MGREEIERKRWEPRETFAFFGRAFCMASEFEVGLAHALLYSEFVSEVKRRNFQPSGKDFDHRRYEAEFDDFFENRFAQTIQNLLREIGKIPEITEELRHRIVAAKKRRDFLSHTFLQEHAKDIATSCGCVALREELQKDIEIFEQIDIEINTAFFPARKNFRIKDRWLTQHFENMTRELLAETAINQSTNAT